MPDEAGRAFSEHLDFAFQVALSVTRDPADAEDAVQDAYLRFRTSWKGFDRTRPVRPYLARAVVHAALDRARTEKRREARERSRAPEEAVMPGDAAHVREERAALRAALLALPGETRMAVSLRYLHGLSLEETAGAIGLARSTASDRVQQGLAELRKVLGAAGFGALALPGAIGALPQPAAPAALAGKLGAALSNAKTAGAGAVAVKGGFVMKLVAGIVLAGVVAGVAAVSMRGNDNGGALPAGAPKTFAIGMHDPAAQWVREGTWGGIGIPGYLDGPRLGVRGGSGPSPGGWFDKGNGRFVFREYDTETEVVRTAVGSTLSYLDGPLTRARFGGWGYVHGLKSVRSPDKRYIWFIDHYSGGLLRRVDFEEEMVTTLSKDLKGLKAMSADKAGNLYLVQYGAVAIMSPDGKTRTQKLEIPDGKLYSHGFNAKMDDVHNRLYGMNRNGPNGWYVWYWDLAANGKFVGVLPSPDGQKGVKLRSINTTGPFKGSKLRCPSGISFGAHVDTHNPERRWLFMGGGDNTTFYRLDLEKEILACFGPPDAKQKKPYKDLAFVQVARELSAGSISRWAGCPGLDEEGNIYLKVAVWPSTIRFKRVK